MKRLFRFPRHGSLCITTMLLVSGAITHASETTLPQLGENEFLVTGHLCRIDFKPTGTAAGAKRDFLHVEEGNYEGGVFRPARIWNGDETDWGLNFSAAPQVLRVPLGTF